MKKIVIITLLTAFALFSQPTPPAYFSAWSGAVSLSGAGYTVTLQQPATNGEQIHIDSAVVACSVACTITQTQNATGITNLTGTAGTVSGTNPTPNAVFAVTFWKAVTLTGGVDKGDTICSGACTVPFTYPNLSFGNTGINTNYSLTVSSITGTVYMGFYGHRD